MEQSPGEAMKTMLPMRSRIVPCAVLLPLLLAACTHATQTRAVDSQQAQYALWDAAKGGDVAALRQALSAGADVDAIDTRTNPNGRRALNWAAWHNHVEIIEELLRHGADVDGVNHTGFTPLHHAAESGAPEAARVLIEAGADVNLPSLAGETPLQRARREGHHDVVRLLEAAGAK